VARVKIGRFFVWLPCPSLRGLLSLYANEVGGQMADVLEWNPYQRKLCPWEEYSDWVCKTISMWAGLCVPRETM
jgi:hypothetical protein